jgi:hypothetical protein
VTAVDRRRAQGRSRDADQLIVGRQVRFVGVEGLAVAGQALAAVTGEKPPKTTSGTQAKMTRPSTETAPTGNRNSESGPLDATDACEAP